MKKRILSMTLVLAMAVSLCACGGGADEDETTKPSNSPATKTDVSDENPTYEDLSSLSHNDRSTKLYDLVLGDFYKAYSAAKEAETVSEKFAMMAIAEAKMLESGVLLPTTSNGGNYAVSKLAPYSVDYTLWGNDSYRYHQALVCTEFITSEDRTAMKEKWAELKGTGTFAEWQKNYLKEKGYTFQDTYTYGYNTDPQTWDVLATYLAADSEAIINTYDGLLEYDCEGELQPALAESYTVSEDGLTYTFKIREGAVWVDSQGRKVADVTADDFVAGAQHGMDAQGGLEYLYQAAGITGVDDYMYNGASFDKVGVKAADEHTLVYTLDAPCTYFTTMLGYGVFAPLSRAYFTSQGGKFGVDEFKAIKDSADYTYGKTPDSIAYCGPYLVTNATAENTIVFDANPTYWNKDNINVHKITWLYNDGSDATKAYNDTKAGVLDGCGLNASALELAKKDGNFDKYGYVSSTDATTYNVFFNLNRSGFANANDPSKMISTQTEEEAKRTNQAMRNVHFRRAICFAVDRGSYNAMSVGEELKYNSLRNSYVPGTFVVLEEDVTVDINGTATTFAKGTNYGAIVQAQLDADGFKAKVYDADADEGVGSSDGYDGWYNVANAVEELNKAIEQLSAQGLTVDKEHPIHLDLPCAGSSQTNTNMMQAMKQSIENALDGKVIVDVVSGADIYEYYYATYYFNAGDEANYDLNTNSGWGPDYGDPSTYLDTFLPDGDGSMTKCVGLY